MLFFKSKKRDTRVATLQYIGFPVVAFDDLSKAEKNNYYMEINKGSWEFSLRAMGWIIESRISDGDLPTETESGIFGVKGARVFSHQEVRDIREYMLAADESHILNSMSETERELKQEFETFAQKFEFFRMPYLRALRVMRCQAAQGRVVSEDDLKTNPMFRRLGNLNSLFGDKLASVLEFQNMHASQVRASSN